MTRPCPGPLPPLPPATRAPPGTCDTHAHIVGPYDRFPLDDGRFYTAPESPLEAYAAMQEALGIERAVIVHPSCYGTDLAVTVDGLARLGERARGVAVVAPDIDDERLRELDGLGFRGVRFAPVLLGGDPMPVIQAFAPRAARLGWHIDLFIDGPREMTGMLAGLKALDIDLVLDHFAHFGGADGVDDPGFAALIELVAAGRCWVKLSCPDRLSATGPPYEDMAPLAKALIGTRPDRMLWATDWPHVGHWDQPIPEDAGLVDWLSGWGVDEPTLESMLVDNPAALFGFA